MYGDLAASLIAAATIKDAAIRRETADAVLARIREQPVEQQIAIYRQLVALTGPDSFDTEWLLGQMNRRDLLDLLNDQAIGWYRDALEEWIGEVIDHGVLAG